MTTFNTSRQISATIVQVFAAISDPVRLARWWGPNGFTNTFTICEFEEGGRWSLVMHGPDGKSYPSENRFAAIEVPTRVIVEHASQPTYRLTIGLEPTDAGVLVTWSQAFEDPEVGRRLESIVVPANDQNLKRLEHEVFYVACS